jgi:hypothetical protein
MPEPAQPDPPKAAQDSREYFLAPVLRGERFDGTRLPFEIAGNLLQLGHFIAEVASYLFFKENPGRSRVPPGFHDSFKLSIIGLEDGSAIPVIERDEVTDLSDRYDAKDDHLFTEARDQVIRWISNAASAGVDVPLDIPQDFLEPLADIARDLREDESIEFVKSPQAKGTGPRLTPAIRRRMTAQARLEYNRPTGVLGTVRRVDVGSQRFGLLLQSEDLIEVPFDLSKRELLVGALKEHPRRGVLVTGIGIYSRGKLVRFEKVSDIKDIGESPTVAKTDVQTRIESLAGIPPNWFKGSPPDHERLIRLGNELRNLVSHGMPNPFLYARTDGNIQAEWSAKPWDIAIEFDLPASQALGSALNLRTDKEYEIRLDLKDPDSYNKLSQFVLSYYSGLGGG